jgi:hypothetical protein
MLHSNTPSDHRYGDATNNAMPQGNNTYWAPGLDASQPAITDPEHRHGPSRLHANQFAYASATPPFSLTHCDLYPVLGVLGETRTDCPEQFAYHPQQYQSVSYVAHNWAEYPVGYLCPHDPAEHLPSFSFRSFQVVPTMGSILPSPQQR